MKEVASKIFVGSYKDCQNTRKLKYRKSNFVPMGIVHIGNSCGCDLDDEWNKTYDIDDLAEEIHEAKKICSVLDNCESFIDTHRQKNGVLIHCRAGVSRSPTVVFLYLLRKKEISTYNEFRELYQRWNPNNGFYKLIQEIL